MGNIAHDKMSSFVAWFFKDKQGKWAVAQVPNIPLILWFLLSFVAHIIKGGHAKEGFALLAHAALLTWSYLEITSGISRFRRVLGAIVLAAVSIGFFI